MREIDNRTHADMHVYHEAALDALRARNRELELKQGLLLIFLEHEDEITACFKESAQDAA